jgi:tRNA modification GTPase
MAEPELIAAVATAPGTGAIGVVRISGPGLRALLVPLLGREPEPRRALLADFLDQRGQPIDEGLALYFPGPHSYTGEDMLELQGHGGPTVLQQLLKRCLELGARLAEPGEFTRRAFLNGKLDLAQAEGVADLIEARSEAAARSALRSLQGGFSREIHALVADVTNLRLLVEACIDFPEEGIDQLPPSVAETRLKLLIHRVQAVEGAARRGSLLREGARVALIGRPNVGKSSLLNKLADEDVAIVTDWPGTTRDVIRQELLLEGVPIHVLDTAGLRPPADPIERLGIERTRAVIERTDLVLFVADIREGLTAEDLELLGELPPRIKRILVLNKIDLNNAAPGACDSDLGRQVRVSALSGAGLDELRREILEALGWCAGEEGTFLARARHLEALQRAAGYLAQAADRIAELELFAEELRLVQRALGEITGEVTADDLLGRIFAEFCIGK